MNIMSGLRSIVLISAFFWLLMGCASYGIVQNTAIDRIERENSYSITGLERGDRAEDISFTLSFSGGGTRAAAMAYGVMEELRDTMVLINGEQKRLLDEVDNISSVSGGSFTAAYYGLHGERMFDIFEDEFLRFDLESKLMRSLVNPFHWVGRKGRTERSIEIYDKYLFHNATFADMMAPGRPMIVINASDLSHGVRFSFIQEYFNLLCSDLASFPVSRAVTASSAVPIVFNPVVVENYGGCPDMMAEKHEGLLARIAEEPELNALYDGLASYSDKQRRKYIHFVDGGITDNMGLRAMSDVMQVAGGPREFLKKTGKQVPRAIVFISVNASTEPETEMDATNKQPSIAKSMSSLSSVQLHRYNVATLELVKNELEGWAASLSTPERPVKAYFIQVSFENIKQAKLKLFLNKVPTSFDLSDEQVDTLTDSARQLLRNNPDFQALLADIGDL